VDRIILFDVDQTLLYSGGAGSRAMAKAFLELYGIEDGFGRVEFSGRTDSSILQQALRQHGLLDGDDAWFETERKRFQGTYYRLLEPTLEEVTGGTVMPGVPALLARLSEEPGVRQGLATGNFREAAFIKLRYFQLDGHLDEGGFGEDALDRGEMVGVAIERLANGSAPDPRSVWIVGDTPLDIAAAQANGARSLGVGTGSSSAEELRSIGADVSLDDLSDLDAVLSALLD